MAELDGVALGKPGHHDAAVQQLHKGMLPALGAYVGGDIVGGALASGMDRDKRLRVFIDGSQGLVPEISGNRLMFSVRMMRMGEDHRLHGATDGDVNFELSLCA